MQRVISYVGLTTTRETYIIWYARRKLQYAISPIFWLLSHLVKNTCIKADTLLGIWYIYDMHVRCYSVCTTEVSRLPSKLIWYTSTNTMQKRVQYRCPIYTTLPTEGIICQFFNTRTLNLLQYRRITLPSACGIDNSLHCDPETCSHCSGNPKWPSGRWR